MQIINNRKCTKIIKKLHKKAKVSISKCLVYILLLNFFNKITTFFTIDNSYKNFVSNCKNQMISNNKTLLVNRVCHFLK